MRTFLFSFLFLLTACSGAPPSPFPPSASDLDLLGLTRLCDSANVLETRWKSKGLQESPWGTGTEWYIETNEPDDRKQWLFFNDDQTLVAAVSAFPSGLNLSPYPVLRNTLSQLKPAREFFLDTNLLIRGSRPKTVVLYRTGDEKSTTQYVVRQSSKRDEAQLLVAVIVLDPYEQLLDGAQSKFMPQPSGNDGKNSSTRQAHDAQSTSKFLATQQFARGETSLFESCRGKKPEIAINAYRRAIHLGLNDKKRLAEAHHRLGLALRNDGQLDEAREAVEESLTIQPHAPRVLNSLGTILIQLNKHSQAIVTLEKAIALQPNYHRARYNLAEAYENVNPRRAIEEYETYLALVEHLPQESTRAALAKDRLEKLK